MTAEELIEQAMMAMEGEHFEDAAEFFFEAFELNPEDWRLPNEAGTCLYRLERYDDALNAYQKSLALLGDEQVDERVTVLLNKGLALSLASRLDEAWEVFGRVVELDPVNVGAHFEGGKVQQQLGNYQLAIELFDQAVIHDTMASGAGAFAPMDSFIHGMVHLNKARIFLGPLSDLDTGLVHVRTLHEKFSADEVIMDLARELKAAENPNWKSVVETLLALDPDHEGAKGMNQSVGMES